MEMEMYVVIFQESSNLQYNSVYVKGSLYAIWNYTH